MMHHMEIPKCREYDAGQVRVIAKNSEGEEECSTSLVVMPKEDWRAKLKQAPKGLLDFMTYFCISITFCLLYLYISRNTFCFCVFRRGRNRN